MSDDDDHGCRHPAATGRPPQPRVWIVARVAIDGDLRGAQVESLIRDTESSLKDESDSVFRVDIVPIGQEAELDPGLSLSAPHGLDRLLRPVAVLDHLQFGSVVSGMEA